MSYFFTILRGFGMGAADIVPGVSGGTIALVLGIYEQLLDNVRRGAKALGCAAKLDFRGFWKNLVSVEWNFLIPLAVGIGAAVVTLASLIEGLLESRPEEMAGLFFGLVAGSILVAWTLMQRRDSQQLVVIAAVGAVTFLLLGFQSGPIVDPPLPVFFGAGAIAICAMILPGISGSFLLLMMGMYAAVLGAIDQRSSTDLLSLLVFFAGATLGLALFSSGLGWLLDRFHDEVMAVLIGLMVGSFRVLWPWPNGLGSTSEIATESVSGTTLELPTADNFLLPTALAVVAFIVVVGAYRLAPSEPHQEPHTSAPVS